MTLVDLASDLFGLIGRYCYSRFVGRLADPETWQDAVVILAASLVRDVNSTVVFVSAMKTKCAKSFDLLVRRPASP